MPFSQKCDITRWTTTHILKTNTHDAVHFFTSCTNCSKCRKWNFFDNTSKTLLLIPHNLHILVRDMVDNNQLWNKDLLYYSIELTEVSTWQKKFLLNFIVMTAFKNIIGAEYHVLTSNTLAGWIYDKKIDFDKITNGSMMTTEKQVKQWTTATCLVLLNLFRTTRLPIYRASALN